MAFDGLPIQKLANLLKTEDEQDDSEDEHNPTRAIYHTPGTIGAQSKKSSAGSTVHQNKEQDIKSNDIWEENEVTENPIDDRDLDSRPSPEYELMFKQKVTTDDVFLGMSGKNSSTACCEDIVIKIQLPETNKTDIDLDVQNTFLDCKTPKHRLALHLPHTVDSKRGKADWDSNKNILVVTLPLERDLDFMNF
eukprot:Seg430.6 transcript_id=Seg430.6/GoldUCD/mRNA.D3Y31 product="Protein PIH1D3" protein_id=Seg430.6/GoldUCD/D3Y31